MNVSSEFFKGFDMLIELNDAEKKLMIEAFDFWEKSNNGLLTIDARNLRNKIKTYKDGDHVGWNDEIDKGLGDEDSWLKNSLFLRGGW
jgi:hypothetical protein